jgi:hypothetical protein
MLFELIEDANYLKLDHIYYLCCIKVSNLIINGFDFKCKINQAEYEDQKETVENISVINREFIENEILLNRLDTKWLWFLKYINYVS